MRSFGIIMCAVALISARSASPGTSELLLQAEAEAPALQSKSHELAQLPWFRRRATPEPMYTQPTATPYARPRATRRATATPEMEPRGDYVNVADLAAQLKRIDSTARVEWDTKVLRINVSGQKFSLFPTGNEIVVNGNVEQAASPLVIRGRDILVPQTVVDRIATQLESSAVGATKETTSAVAQATPHPTPTATVTPVPSATPLAVAAATPGSDILPVVTPPQTQERTPVPTAPSVTPEITAAPPARPTLTPIPAPPPVPTAPPAATQTPWRIPTPGPTATAEPTTVVSLSPTRTPESAVMTRTPARTPRKRSETGKDRPAATATQAAQSVTVDTFNRSLREKADLPNYSVKQRKGSELHALAAQNFVRKVVIDPDGSAADPGAARNASTLALQVANRVRSQLEAKGIDTVMTRTGNEHVPLGKKLEIVNNSEAQLLLTITVGTSDFPELSGFRILYVSDSVDYSALRYTERETPDGMPLPLSYRPFQDRNKMFGSALQNALQRVIKEESVGINPSPLWLAKRAPMASALVIVGYDTNPVDSARLRDNNQQDMLAAAIAEGVFDYREHLSGGSSGMAALAKGSNK